MCRNGPGWCGLKRVVYGGRGFHVFVRPLVVRQLGCCWLRFSCFPAECLLGHMVHVQLRRPLPALPSFRDGQSWHLMSSPTRTALAGPFCWRGALAPDSANQRAGQAWTHRTPLLP